MCEAKVAFVTHVKGILSLASFDFSRLWDSFIDLFELHVFVKMIQYGSLIIHYLLRIHNLHRSEERIFVF